MNRPPVVLVTGASRGLGRGIAVSCARAGFSVAVHYASNEKAARETVALCRASSGSAQEFHPVQCNLAMSAERVALWEQTIAAFGHVDALVNNAGMAPRVRVDLTQTTEESYDEVMEVNLKGPFFLSQMAARYWLERPGQSRLAAGYHLLFITSISADTVSVNRGEYCLSKAGLAMTTQLWAARLAGHGVHVHEIRPGIMETDMTAGVKERYNRLLRDGLVPQQLWGTPEDVGRAVQAILRGDFPFSTGAIIPVDGGLHLRRL
jgi:3-oxoacyl-[acyl-carrier protein] reductase